MALKAEQMVNERQTSFPIQNLSPVSINQQDNFKVSKPDVNDHKQENDSNLLKFPKVLAEKENLKDQTEAQLDVKDIKEDKIREVRQEPEGQLAESTLREEPKKIVVGCVKATDKILDPDIAIIWSNCACLIILKTFNELP